ncbi:MAG: aspartate carbamoyltransferase [Spirochaetales bacterium]|nr:aspartate carbamoyltransferase [Spirochaetales bacterium]
MHSPVLINKDILSTKNLNKQELLAILKAASCMEKLVTEKGVCPMLTDTLIAFLFLEPSTRTRLSFEAAAERLGAKTISVADAGSSSILKGESLSDMVKVVAGYADCIVLRQSAMGLAETVAGQIAIPLINAGDGHGQHPTQALLDLYTISKELGKLESLKIALVGDLKYGRTVHSLCYALLPFQPEFVFCAPKDLYMPSAITNDLKSKGVCITEVESLEQALQADVLYMTRIQKERFPDQKQYELLKGSFVLKKELVLQQNKDVLILHPLPRVDEIDTHVDELPRAAYFRQAHNGMYVRMALLAMVLGKDIPGL